jgi:hypothetical protein
MAKGKDKMDELFDAIIKEIGINGLSLLKAIKGKMAAHTFYDLIKDEDKLQRYARACDDRADLMADELLDIADEKTGDVNRDRLRVDSRKWLLAKLRPKKYGDKIEHEHSGGITLNFDVDDSKA